MSQNDRGNQGRSEEDADDVRLMQLVGRGDTRAFEQLIEKHQTLVTGTVARMLGWSSDVEDIAQQVFIRVWKSARRYEQLSYEQIAEVLNLSVPAVKSVLFRARTELRSRLSKYLD